MNIFERIRGKIFREEREEEITEAEQKEFESVYEAIQPVYKDIPPAPKAGKFLTEGVRSWAFMAISAIADEVSTNDIILQKKSGKDWIKQDNHQALNLIEKPNSFQTKEEFLWLVTVYLLAEGEAPILLDNAKNPKSMVLLNPERIKPQFDSKLEGIGSYEYQKTNGGVETIEAEKLIFLKIPSLSSPFRGAGILKYISQTLDIDNFTEEYLRYFFFNSALPTGVLESDQELNESIVKRIRRQFESKHKGVKNAHRIAILEKGLKFSPTSFKMNELEMVAMNNLIRDKVLAGFRVPKSVLGIIEDVNRASSSTADNAFVRRAVKPKLRLIQGQLNQMLLPKFSDGQQGNLWFTFEDPVKDDLKMQAEIDKIYLESGVLTVDEVRQKLGLDPIEMVDDEQDEQEDEQEENETQERQVESSDTFSKVLKEYLSDGEIKQFFSEKEIFKYHMEKIQRSEEIEEEYRGKLEFYFRKQEIAIMDQLKGLKQGTKAHIDIKFDKKKQAEILAELSLPFMKDAIKKQSGLTFALLGLSDELTGNEDIVKEFLQDRAFKTAESVNDQTKDKIDGIIKGWNEDEETITELRKRLRKFLGDENKNRADMIARTEISRANGFATQTVYEDAGVVGKQWITAQDERVCQFCGPMDRNIIPIKRNFWNKNESMTGAEGGKLGFGFEAVETYPLHPQCRCDIIPIFDEQEIPNNPFGYKSISEERDKKIKEEKEKIKELEKREDELNKKELELVGKEEGIAKEEDRIKKEKKKVKDAKKKADEKIKELEDLNKELNG